MRSQLNGPALRRLGGVENQVAIAELGLNLGGGGFSGAVALEAEQLAVQARVGGEGEAGDEQDEKESALHCYLQLYVSGQKPNHQSYDTKY